MPCELSVRSSMVAPGGRLPERRPPAAGLELLVAAEQLGPADDARVDARLVVVPEAAGEGRLRRVPLGHRVLLGREPLAQLLVRELHLVDCHASKATTVPSCSSVRGCLRRSQRVLADYPRPSRADLRWSTPTQWLVNIRPLGDVAAALVPGLVEALERDLDGAPKVKASFGPVYREGWLMVPVLGLDDLRDVVFEATEELVPLVIQRPWNVGLALAARQGDEGAGATAAGDVDRRPRVPGEGDPVEGRPRLREHRGRSRSVLEPRTPVRYAGRITGV